VPQRHFKEAHVLAMVNKRQNERKKKRNSRKRKQTEEQLPQRGVKEALVSDNEESEDEE